MQGKRPPDSLSTGRAESCYCYKVKMINIRKLAAIDMAWLGTRVIVAEYALGVIFPLTLGLLSIRAVFLGSQTAAWEAVLGVWLLFIGLNYMPLLIYAILIARAGTAKQESQAEMAHAKRYGLQQVIILVPLMVIILALVQERHRIRNIK